ncbi:MAG: ribonuclease J, partial [bacterium]
DKLGVDIMIPSFTYLKERMDSIAAIIITHGHNDVMAALPYLLKEIHDVPVYAPTLTGKFIAQIIDHYERHNSVDLHLDLHCVRRDSSTTIDGIKIEFFPVTHSIPGSIGVAFQTENGYFVYAGEFIVDFGAPEGFKCNLQKMMDIGRQGVLGLAIESSYAYYDGYTSPSHKLTDRIDHLFEEATGRIIITSYAQNVFRTKEIVELTKKYNRKIVFYGRDKYDNTNMLLRIEQGTRKPVIEIENKYLGRREDIGNEIIDRNFVILLSGNPQKIYNDLVDVLDGGDELLKIRSSDKVIVASPVLPGTEKISTKAINDLYKTDADIHVLKNRDLRSMHASKEDIKVLLQIFNPKYYFPIKGEYRHLVANANVAVDMGVPPDHIIIQDNGEQTILIDGMLKGGKEIFEISNVMIDGSGIGDVGDKVINDRVQLSNDGVVVVGITIDHETKEIIAQTDTQARGFVYLRDYAYIIKEIIAICEKCVNDMIHDPSKDMQDIRNA